MALIGGGPGEGTFWWDKVPSKFEGWGEAEFRKGGFRAVPNCIVRRSAYIAPDVVLMAHAYSAASLYGHAAGVHVPVFGLGSFHARQDDLVVDYSRFDGRTIRVLRTSAPAPGEYEPFFASVRTWQIVQDGQPFHVIEGRGFDYVAYRERVLREVNRRYYAFPSWLPVRGCVFCERLCGAPRCAP